jgi:hypothetical protein
MLLYFILRSIVTGTEKICNMSVSCKSHGISTYFCLSRKLYDLGIKCNELKFYGLFYFPTLSKHFSLLRIFSDSGWRSSSNSGLAVMQVTDLVAWLNETTNVSVNVTKTLGDDFNFSCNYYYLLLNIYENENIQFCLLYMDAKPGV